MESLSLPCTPPPKAGDDQLPPPRNSMEDADSSVTRKRPRLDSGTRSLAKMPEPAGAGSQISSPLGIDALRPEVTEEAPERVPSSDDETGATDTLGEVLQRTPSRVTINVRDSTAAFSPSNVQERQTTQQPIEGIASSAEPGRPAPSGTSVTSVTVVCDPAPSPRSDSVDIEVAEPEDIHDHVGPTIWRRGGRVGDLTEWQEKQIAQFLHLAGTIDTNAAMGKLTSTIRQGTSHSLATVESLCSWIEDYMEETRDAASLWSTLFYAEMTFWHDLPSILINLASNKEASDYAQLLASNDKARSDFQSLLSIFGTLTARMVRVDIATLVHTNKEGPNADPEVWASDYIRALGLYTHPFLRSTFRFNLYGVDVEWYQLAEPCMRHLASEQRLIESLSAIVELLMKRTTLSEDLCQYLLQLLQIVYAISSYVAELSSRDPDHDATRMAADLTEFFLRVDEILRLSVKKQSSYLSYDLLKPLYICFSQIIDSIAKVSPDILKQIVSPERARFTSQMATPERGDFARMAWTTKLLSQCVRQGRMEVRVMGMGDLVDLLVDVHCIGARSSTAKSPENSLVDFLCDFLLDSGLVAYLFGAESHPQIVQRADKVLGFLAVSGRYTDSDTDQIWHAALISQDPRMYEAILEVLPEIGRHLSPQAITYVCEKLRDLPVDRFSGAMVKMCDRVLDLFRSSRARSPGEDADLLPARLVLRLLRQAASNPDLAPNRRQAIWRFARAKLYEQARDMNQLEKAALCKDCIQDLEAQTLETSGSCCAINVLLDTNTETTIQEFAQIGDLAALVVTDYARLEEPYGPFTSALRNFQEPLMDRLHILLKVAMSTPESLSSAHVARLWPSMIGEFALNDFCRNSAWQTLVRIIEKCTSTNNFIDLCVSGQIGRTEPKYFTAATFAFANKLLEYQDKVTQQEGSGVPDQDGFGSGDQLLWQLALSIPDEVIGTKAVQAVVDYQIGKGSLAAKGRELPEAQARLVQRCIENLNRAAGELQQLKQEPSNRVDDITLVAPITTTRAGIRLKFRRCFAILRDFMSKTQSFQPPSPSIRSDLQTNRDLMAGEKVKLKYQPYDSGQTPGVRTIEMGSLATISDLVAQLSHHTGFANFTIISAGQKMDLEQDCEKSIADTRVHEKGLLLVRKAPGSEASRPIGPRTTMQALDREVMKHFTDLHRLLDVDAELGGTVLEFLTYFDPPPNVRESVCDTRATANMTFPMSSPFKSLYALHVFRRSLTRQCEEGSLDLSYMQHAVHVLSELILSVVLPSVNLDIIIVLESAVRTLLTFLKEPVPVVVSRLYFSNPATLLDHLRLMAEVCILDGNPQICLCVAVPCIETMLEASMVDHEVWQHFKAQNATLAMLRSFLLMNFSEDTKTATARAIKSICIAAQRNTTARDGSAKEKEEINPGQQSDLSDYSRFFWEYLVVDIQLAAEHKDAAMQFFSLAMNVFQSLDHSVISNLPLESYVQTWSELLLRQRSSEIVGYESIDCAIHGLASLISLALEYLAQRGTSMMQRDYLSRAFFTRQLFPSIKTNNIHQTHGGSPAALRPETRAQLYQSVLQMNSDDNGIRLCLNLVRDVMLDDGRMDLGWVVDRSLLLRSPAGYPGMRNLSNTCYLNSLVTQLFMNPQFREFIFEATILDPDGKQSLLHQMRNLFANLQNSWQKFIETSYVAESVETYDGGPIDPSIQMDVDEAFNLLFDRLESQIANSAEKTMFKSIFGGQIVQQIKSKDCPHISERLEPFSAVQCEIQGKANLIESLQAYIEGETMEGDNKYSCSTCGQYVNAVKRACLKDIPDNLIFHLKRFEYDLMTGMRSKINDRFAFPDEIDMTPYNVEHLQDISKPASPDPFVLVGVLVHSGTAEAGHYYSYMRERPLARDSWVEFNDADVSNIDKANLEDQCFGGWSEQSFTGVSWPKMWSAYMLFYQRKSSMAADERHFDRQNRLQPFKIPLEHRLALDITIANRKILHSACLFDPEFARFLRSVLEKYYQLNKEQCTPDHSLEDNVVSCALMCLEQIFCREKDRPEALVFLDQLMRQGQRCVKCCKNMMSWLIDRGDTALRSLLLRQPDEAIRQRLGSLVFVCMRNLKLQDPGVYGIVEGEMTGNLEEGGGGFFVAFARHLRSLQLISHFHGKSWDDFYSLLANLCQLGLHASVCMRQLGMLQHALETLLIDNSNPRFWAAKFPRHRRFIELSEKRHFPRQKLVAFIATMLRAQAQLGVNSSRTADEVEYWQEQGLLSPGEIDALNFMYSPPRDNQQVLWFLERAVVCEAPGVAATKEIVKALLSGTPGRRLEHKISSVITWGTRREPAEYAAPYLELALTFFEMAAEPEEIMRLAEKVCRDAGTIEDSGGEEHVNFMAKARRGQNPVAFPENPKQMALIILQYCPMWATTFLLYKPRCSVREQAKGLLEDMLSDPDEETMDDEELADTITTAVRGVALASMAKMEELVKDDVQVDENKVLCFNEVARHCVKRTIEILGEDSEDGQTWAARYIELSKGVQELTVPATEIYGAADSDDQLTDASSAYADYSDGQEDLVGT